MPALEIATATGEVVEVLVIVRFLLVLPLLLPSIVTKSAPLKLIKAPLATEPEIVAVTVLAGFIVKVFVEDA